jgi:hypothetical protein
MCAYAPQPVPFPRRRQEPALTPLFALGTVFPWIAAFAIGMVMGATGPDVTGDMLAFGVLQGGSLLTLAGFLIAAHYRNVPLAWAFGVMTACGTGLASCFFMVGLTDSQYNHAAAGLGVVLNPVTWGFGIAQLVRLHRIKREETRAQEEAAAVYWAQQYQQYQQQYGTPYGPTTPPIAYPSYQPYPPQMPPAPRPIAPYKPQAPALPQASDVLMPGQVALGPSPPPQLSTLAPTIPPAANAPAAAAVVPGYTLVSELWDDGMSMTYSAQRARDGLECWVRVIERPLAADAAFVAAFRQEVQQAARLFHMNIPSILESGGGWEAGPLHVATQAVAGQPLAELLTAGQRIDPGRAVAIARTVCEVLAYIHGAGLLHLDLRPDHILVAADGETQLTGLGIGPALAAANLASGEAAPRGGLYLSPEHAGPARPDQRSDVYSLGVVLYHMVTGRVPFEGATVAEVLQKHRTEAPRDPQELNPGISPALREAILSALAKDPNHRPQDASRLLEMLRAAT